MRIGERCPEADSQFSGCMMPGNPDHRRKCCRGYNSDCVYVGVRKPRTRKEPVEAAALRLMAVYYARPHKGYGGCSICPIQGPKCPGWRKVCSDKVCGEAIKESFLKKARART